MWCIVQRECRDLLRRPRSLWHLGLGLLVFALVFTQTWGTITRHAGEYRPGMGREIFLPSAMMQLLFLLGLGRIAASSIAREREKDTWDLLIISPVRLRSVILGKLVGSLLYMSLVYLALLPMLALCLILGGISPREMFGAYLILAGSALLAASVGLLLSSFMRSSISAVRTTTLILILYAIMPILIGKFAQGMLVILGGSLPYFLWLHLSPLFAMELLFEAAGRRPGVAPQTVIDYPEWFFFISAAAISAVLLIRVVRRIGSFESHPPFAVREKNRKSRGLALQERRGISDTANPIWAKEAYEQNARRFLKPRVTFLTLLLLGIFIGLMAVIFMGYSPTLLDIFKMISIVTLIGVIIYAPTGPAGAITREKDRNTWDLLRTSACSSLNILAGKTLAELRYILCCTACFFLGLYGTTRLFRNFGEPIRESEYSVELLYAVLLLASCVIFYVCAAIYFSSRAKDTAKAQAHTFVIILLHCLGPFLLAVIMELILQTEEYGGIWRDITDFVAGFTPLTLLLNKSWFFQIGTDTWAIEVMVQSIIIVLIGILFLFAAQRRIDRYEE